MIRFLVWLFGIQSAVACIVVKEDKILLTKRSSLLIEGNKWCLPGGGIKKWEKSVDAARRELREETGLTVKKIKFLFVHEELVRRLKIHANVFVFEIRSSGKIKTNFEVCDYGWFSRERIEKMSLAFNHKDILEKYFKGKGKR